MGYGNVSKFGIISTMLDDCRDNINENTVFRLNDPSTSVTSLFIYEDAPQFAYDVAGAVYESSFITDSSGELSLSSPVINTSPIREYLNADDDWQYNGYMKSDPSEDDKISLELFNKSNQRMLEYDFGYLFDNFGAIDLYRDFLIECTARVINGEIDYSALKEMIDDFEVNLNIIAE